MTKVFVVSDVHQYASEEREINDKPYSDTSLEQEKIDHEEKALNRRHQITNIIMNKQDDRRNICETLIKSCGYTLSIVIVGFSLTIPYTILPAHDIIQYPDYWYEHFFHSSLSETIGNITFCLLAGYVLNIHHILRPRNILIMCSIGNVVQIVFLVVVYAIWTLISGYQYPMPLMGLLDAYTSLSYRLITFWFLFPAKWRKSVTFQSRVKFLILALFFIIVMDILYNIASTLLQRFRNNYQPIVALILPIMRKFILHIYSKLMKKTSNGDLIGASIIMKYRISIQHTLFLCYAMGSFTTQASQWVLMGFGFLTMILLCQRIVKLHQKGNQTIDLQVSLVQDLVTFELAQFHSQLSFILVFAVAYYGPNSMLFGNVANNYWNFKAIEDIQVTLGNMVLFFLVDCTSAITSAIILKVFCNINLWKIFAIIEKEFGIAFCLFSGRFLLLVRSIFYTLKYIRIFLFGYIQISVYIIYFQFTVPR